MKNNRYKLLVVDIDGTLIGKNRVISAEDKDAVTRARNAGIQVSLSTGRVMRATLGIINQLSLDGYHVFFDGALVSNPESGEEVYVQALGQDVVRQAVDFTRRNDINLDLYSVNQYFVERETWSSDIRREFFGLQPNIVDFNGLGQKERIIKGTIVVRSAEERAKAESFRLYFKDSFSFSVTRTPAYPDVDFINVVDPSVSKGRALEALALHLKIPLAEVIAIGDGENDVSLLSKSGLAIAMGNAPDKLKAIADYVTLDSENNGVAAAVERFLL